jgi:hypothetical protein
LSYIQLTGRLRLSCLEFLLVDNHETSEQAMVNQKKLRNKKKKITIHYWVTDSSRNAAKCFHNFLFCRPQTILLSSLSGYASALCIDHNIDHPFCRTLSCNRYALKNLKRSDQDIFIDIYIYIYIYILLDIESFDCISAICMDHNQRERVWNFNHFIPAAGSMTHSHAVPSTL